MKTGAAPGKPERRARSGAAILSLVLLPVLFVLDRQLPMGVAVGMLYVVPVLLTLWSPPRLTLLVASTAALLAIADVLLSAPESVTWMAALNRLFALVAIASTAVLVYLARRAAARNEEREHQRHQAASEQKYRAVLENAVDAIFLCSMDGRIQDANHRAAELLGYTREELLGMTAEDLHPPEEHERLHEVFRELTDHGRTLIVHPVLRKNGQVIYCEVAASLIQVGDQRIAQGIFRDVSERERRSQARFDQEKRHRDTLVREVHHRIKNNLQGVVGLLRQHADAHPELYDVIGAAIGQVQSISVIHGLQGQGEDLHVRLCDMVGAIARNASTLTRADVELEVELAGPNSVCINKDEAVAVALIVNELIQNAVKHSAGADARKVLIRVLRSQAAAEVRVINSGRLAPDFDFARGQGRGTGLGLVRSLLPHTGATLNYEQVDSEVHAGLRLAPPVMTPDAPCVAPT